MDNQGNGSSSHNDDINKLQTAVMSLEKRVEVLENKLEIKSLDTSLDTSEVHKTVSVKKEQPVKKTDNLNMENLSAATQLGWLGVIILLVGAAFIVRLTFLQGIISGWGQPITLGCISIALIVVSDILWSRQFKKFASCLTVCGYIVLFLALYWASIHLKLTGNIVIPIGSILIWLLSIIWGFKRGSSLWPIWGFIGAGTLPLFMLDSQFGAAYFPVYLNILIIVSLISSVKKDWRWFPAAATIVGHTAMFIAVRHFFKSSENYAFLIQGLLLTVPSFLILWSGLIHIYNKRKARIIETIIWIFNNLICYAGIKSIWSKIDIPYILLVPIIMNGALYFTSRPFLSDIKYRFPYLVGLVISAAIALNVILPMPFDIISLSLLAVYLGYRGDRKQGWDYKGLSGVMIVWSLIFLFGFRFGFTAINEIPFLNFRFTSFAVAFLCYGFLGKMINSDPSAGKMGPFLGQSLFSLGLLVLLSAIGGEIYHLFPPQNQKLVSQNALLGMTIVGALFSFVVTYIGVVLRLFFIRILAIVLFILLVSKMIFFDLYNLQIVYLIISLGIVGALLGGASIILKRASPSKKDEAEKSMK